MAVPTGLSDADAAAWRRERRAAARRWHPDRGGSESDLVAALAAVDARYSGGGGDRRTGASPVVMADLGLWSHRLLVLWRRAVDQVRQRRYIDI